MKTAIIYATKYGTVQNVAQMIAAGLKDGATLINVKDAKKLNLDEYGQVVLGGSVYIGRAQKELTAYASSNLDKLMGKRTALFLCAARPEPEALQEELKLAYPAALLSKAAYAGTVGSAIDLQKVNFLEKAMLKKVMKLEESYSRLNTEEINKLINALS
jgi:menaquinone-dependent protoporphyrinogen oxidase